MYLRTCLLNSEILYLLPQAIIFFCSIQHWQSAWEYTCEGTKQWHGHHIKKSNLKAITEYYELRCNKQHQLILSKATCSTPTPQHCTLAHSPSYSVAGVGWHTMQHCARFDLQTQRLIQQEVTCIGIPFTTSIHMFMLLLPGIWLFHSAVDS